MTAGSFALLLFSLILQANDPVADPGFGQGGGQKSFPRFCRRSEAKSGDRSEPILAGVQGPP